MLVTVDQLQVGDEIIVPSNSNLKYVKVLAEPKEKGVGYRGKMMYKTLRCSIYGKPTSHTSKSYNGRVYTTKQSNYEYCDDVSKHNLKINLNLNYTQIYLVKRNGIPTILNNQI
jgi:hypothetical protein